MLDARRHRLLREMGITPWRLRPGADDSNTAPALVISDPPHDALSGLDQFLIPLPAKAGKRWLEVVGAELSPPAVKKLLTAMLAAIKLDLNAANASETLPSNTHSNASDYVLAFGDQAGQALSGQSQPVSALRGQWQHTALDSRPLIVTHHPATLLQNPKLKAEAWADLQQLQQAWQSGE